jgi:hypothetical protein
LLYIQLLRLLLIKYNYNNYYNLINIKDVKDNYNELYYLFISLEELHSLSENDITVDELVAFFYTKYPDSKKNVYDLLFSNIKDVEISTEVAQTILEKIKLNNIALKLSEESYKFTQGQSSLETLQGLSEELRLPIPQDDLDNGLVMDLESLLDDAFVKPGLRWRLNFLNKSLGSLREGDFGFLMKRPETGGTAFLASELSHMLDQTDRNIIWLNNEEQDNKVAIRVIQAYFGTTLKDLLNRKAYYQEEWDRRVGNRFKFFGIDYSNKKAVEILYEKHKPILFVYDQLDKVACFEADREDLRLGAIYEWARNLCKKSGAAIGVTQANASAEGIKWLHMGHTANSQTSKAAEGDFILGIGKTHNPEQESSRFISICKNKLIGDPDSNLALRHGQAEVLIIPEVMRYQDIIDYD